MVEEEKKEKITLEELKEGIRAVAIVEFFVKKHGTMPHPLRFLKRRRWARDFEFFLEGVEFGEIFMEKIGRLSQDKKTLKEVEESEGVVDLEEKKKQFMRELDDVFDTMDPGEQERVDVIWYDSHTTLYEEIVLRFEKIFGEVQE